MLEGRNISVIRSGHRLVDRVSIQLQPGKVTAVIGPNGAGKTSLLRVLAGEWAADEGEVALDGQSLELVGLKAWSLRHAFLQQESNLDFAFSALEVVMLGRTPHLARGESEEDWAMARQALRDVDFRAPENVPYTRLSGGEKQRVHLARALVQLYPFREDPAAYLFLDEPTNNLDPEHQHLSLRQAREAAKAGLGVGVVLHDLNLAAAWSDEALLMHEGRAVLFGAVGEVLASPEVDRVFNLSFDRIEVPGQAFPLMVGRIHS